MRLEQIKGPFKAGDGPFTFGGTSDKMHIAINIPQRQPIAADWKDRLCYIHTKFSDPKDESLSLETRYKKDMENDFGVTKKYPNEKLSLYSNDFPYDEIQDRYLQEDLIKDHSVAADASISIETDSGVSRFYINRSDILEFDCDVGVTVKISILKNLPPEAVIDVMYNETV